jgi:hypothetical protein
MKNPKIRFAFFLIAILVFAVVRSYAQNPRIEISHLDHLESKASQVVSVDVPENMIKIGAKFLDGKDKDEAAVKEVIAGIKGVYIRSFEFDSDDAYTQEDVRSITSQLDPARWSKMVGIRSRKDGQQIDVYTNIDGTNKINGIAVLVIEKRQLTIVNVVGSIDIDKLAELSGKFHIPEIDIEGSPAKKEGK